MRMGYGLMGRAHKKLAHDSIAEISLIVDTPGIHDSGTPA